MCLVNEFFMCKNVNMVFQFVLGGFVLSLISFCNWTSHRGLVVSIIVYELGGLGSNPSRGIAGFFDSGQPLPRVGVL
jgi:hypothetical protein